MKRSLLGFATLSLLTLFCACNSSSMGAPAIVSASQNQAAITSASCETGESFHYDISANGCDTGDRFYFDRDDLCSGLQLSENNNSCPASEREEYFRKECKGYVWSPDSDGSSDVGSTPKKGLNLECSFSRKIDPSDNDVVLDPLITKRQSTSKIFLVIHQSGGESGYYLNASQQINSNGLYGLVLTIADDAGNVVKTDSDFVTAGKYIDLKIESEENNLQATCHGIDVLS